MMMINTLYLQAFCNFQSLFRCIVAFNWSGTWDSEVDPGIETQKREEKKNGARRKVILRSPPWN